MMKILNNLRIERNVLNVSKGYKTYTNIILNGERQGPFLLLKQTRHRWLLSPLLFNIVIEALSTAIWGENGKGRLKFYLLAYDIILHSENPKEHTYAHTYTHKLEIMNKHSKDTRSKINCIQ